MDIEILKSIYTFGKYANWWFIIILGLGVFVGNWLIVPKYNKKVTTKQGFWVGIMAGIITSILFLIYKIVTYNSWINELAEHLRKLQ